MRGPVSGTLSLEAVWWKVKVTSPGPEREVGPSTPTLKELPCISTRAVYTSSGYGKEINVGHAHDEGLSMDCERETILVIACWIK